MLVDDREPADAVLPHLRSAAGTEVEVQRLPLGDYEVDGRVLFERKTIPDFAASLIEGRLFRQACRLAGLGRPAIYVLEGSCADAAELGVRREAMQGALITLSVVLGLPVLRSACPRETAQLIRYTAAQTDRVDAIMYPRQGYRPKGKLKRQLFILQGLPGVGPERARRLLVRLGSIEKIMTADAETLAAVKGLGTATATRIRWAVA